MDGCAADFTVSCPSWATLTLVDPAVAGDVAVVETLLGWSGPADGECVVAWEEGEAVLSVYLNSL